MTQITFDFIPCKKQVNVLVTIITTPMTNLSLLGLTQWPGNSIGQNYDSNKINVVPIGDSFYLKIDDNARSLEMIKDIGADVSKISKLIVNPTMWLKNQPQIPIWLARLIVVLGGENLCLEVEENSIKSNSYFFESGSIESLKQENQLIIPAAISNWPAATNETMMRQYFANHLEYNKTHLAKVSPTCIKLHNSKTLKILEPGAVSRSEILKLVPKSIKVIDYAMTTKQSQNTESPKIIIGSREQLLTKFENCNQQPNIQKLISLGSQLNLINLSSRINFTIFKAKLDYPNSELYYLPLTKQGRWHQIINYKLSEYAKAWV